MYNEPVRKKDKENTKQNLLDSVGEIIKTLGYDALGVNKIAKHAQVDKKLIYRYFGSTDNLIEEYVLENDYWTAHGKKFIETLKSKDNQSLKLGISHLLHNQFLYFFQEEEMQKIILYELNNENELLKNIANIKDKVRSDLFQLPSALFENSDVTFRSIGALLTAGISYIILYSKMNEKPFCEIDINKKAGQEEILNAITHICDWAFKNANAID